MNDLTLQRRSEDKPKLDMSDFRETVTIWVTEDFPDGTAIRELSRRDVQKMHNWLGRWLGKPRPSLWQRITRRANKEA